MGEAFRAAGVGEQEIQKVFAGVGEQEIQKVLAGLGPLAKQMASADEAVPRKPLGSAWLD